MERHVTQTCTMFNACRTLSSAQSRTWSSNLTPASRFLMPTAVIVRLLRPSGPKAVLAFCSHGSNPGTPHMSIASHTYIGQPLTRILLLLYASKLQRSSPHCVVCQLSFRSELSPMSKELWPINHPEHLAKGITKVWYRSD